MVGYALSRLRDLHGDQTVTLESTHPALSERIGEVAPVPPDARAWCERFSKAIWKQGSEDMVWRVQKLRDDPQVGHCILHGGGSACFGSSQ